MVRMQRIPKEKIVRALMKEIQRPNEERDSAIMRVIRSIPKGKVATYSQIAGAAGYPMYHRLVARILRHSGGRLPWQRVVGAGGEIKLHLDAALEQRLRLEMEGVTFRGRRVNMEQHQHVFRMWEEE
ncbi:MGMT family protein [Paludibaculum fermentans]|uniref:MGMT family protein n=2 Tax=Paludibaculum fermentans TaxID=1473598 RepID=A0A7S7NTQ2_PALFE|nr:MGMT family protein [Paludibaculum fermentans]